MLPAMNLACSGLAPNSREADWLAMAADNEKLRNGIARLYRLFQKAAMLGSLINPRAGEGDLLEAGFHELQPLLERALAQETKDVTAHEMAVTAHGLNKAAEILSRQFTLVATNVPYLGRGKQDEVLQDYCEHLHVNAKADLATCFVERCFEFCATSGTTVLVSPQNWYFLGTYKKLRRQLFKTAKWNLAVKLGPAAFQNMNFWAAKTGLCILSRINPDPPAADRLIALLGDAFGTEWSASRLAGLLAEVDFTGKTLDDWLRDGFFAQHCQLFHQRPFIWHVWDGRAEGFHALVNYHTLAGKKGKRTLEALIYTYLGDWIDHQRADQKAGVEGADGRLAAAEHLKGELEKILNGELPYDLFLRWKPLAEQPIGWEPDVNDGVRLNIRPFISAKPLGARGKGACILRATPKINWDKDRGKEPQRAKEDFPWFWTWDETTKDFAGTNIFDGNRWNGLHYSRAVKEAARARGGK